VTDRRPSAHASKPSSFSEWERLDAMLDEAGRESFPASDPPALMVDDGPRGRAQANEQGGSSGREREERYSWPSSARLHDVELRARDSRR
jgi:hypothetical protein